MLAVQQCTACKGCTGVRRVGGARGRQEEKQEEQCERSTIFSSITLLRPPYSKFDSIIAEEAEMQKRQQQKLEFGYSDQP